LASFLRLAGILGILLVAFPRVILAQREISAIESLAGMHRARVDVIVQAPAMQAGLDSAALRVRVELALRRLGIIVVSQDESDRAPDLSAFKRTAIVQLLISASETAGYVGSHVEIDVRQYASLLREPKDELRPITWAVDEVGTIREGVFADKTAEAVGILLEHFSNDFLAANTRSSESPR
jgi:hypothetical protein